MRILTILACLMLVISACKKKTTEPLTFKGFIKCNINGTNEVFDLLAKADTGTNHVMGGPYPYSLYISGHNISSSSISRYLIIQIGSFDYTTGLREFKDANSTSFYLNHNGKDWYSGELTYYAFLRGTGKLNITELNDGYIKGAFDFTGYQYQTPGTVTLTNGEFHLKLR